MSRRILALFAKAPVPGQVKTRLSPELSPESAAALYEAMLCDIVDQHASERDCERALWFAPADARDWFERFTSAGWRLVPQQGVGLAARMAALFRLHEAEGFDRIVLRGTDSPTLPAGRVGEAFAALEHSELALCPDRDGGYNLIGLRAACDDLFALELSHTGVLSGTLANARSLGLCAELLPAHHDVDTWPDLLRLPAELDATRAPRTLRIVREILPG
ncbi:MAG: glycosyltransferase [Deltaproteobacteria bacterium]|nr:glycosyltransferase [Deltaproteobacteria bacterium]